MNSTDSQVATLTLMSSFGLAVTTILTNPERFAAQLQAAGVAWEEGARRLLLYRLAEAIRARMAIVEHAEQLYWSEAGGAE